MQVIRAHTDLNGPIRTMSWDFLLLRKLILRRSKTGSRIQRWWMRMENRQRFGFSFSSTTLESANQEKTVKFPFEAWHLSRCALPPFWRTKPSAIASAVPDVTVIPLLFRFSLAKLGKLRLKAQMRIQIYMVNRSCLICSTGIYPQIAVVYSKG